MLLHWTFGGPSAWDAAVPDVVRMGRYPCFLRGLSQGRRRRPHCTFPEPERGATTVGQHGETLLPVKSQPRTGSERVLLDLSSAAQPLGPISCGGHGLPGLTR